MVINIDILEGATIQHDNIFYTLVLDNNRITVQELFTGLRAVNSELEQAVLIAVINGIKEQTI